MKKKLISIFLLVLLVITQVNLGLSNQVKAEETIQTVLVRVEGVKGTIAEGTVQGHTALEAIQNLLNQNKIYFHTKEMSFGNVTIKYIDQVSDLKEKTFNSPNFDGWQFIIKNNKGIVVPDSSMDSQIVQSGDNIILYYGDMTTPYANVIKFTPDIVQENQGFKIKFSFNNFDYVSNKFISIPINNAIVTIDNNNYITDQNGEINVSQGLPKGEHSYRISGYNIDKLPTVVMDKGTFTIDNITKTSMDFSDGKYNQLYSSDNSKIIKNIDLETNSTLNYIKNNNEGDAWSAVSLNKYGLKSNDTFLKQSAADIKKSGIKEYSNTDLEKLIMCLIASGYTPYNFMGQNLIAELYNKDINSFQINDAIYALIALNYSNISGDYAITREKLVDFILNKRISYKQNGQDFVGWTLSGNLINPDITGLAINALSNDYNKNSSIKLIVDEAVNSLSKMQNESGYIADNFGYSSESLSVVILGLTSIGVNPEGVQFTKLKGDLVTGLLSFKGSDGAFKHTLDGTNDFIASEQALRALIAVKEFRNNGIYSYYSSSIDSSKLSPFTISDKDLVELGLLPQTGSAIDITGLIIIGFTFIALGALLFKTTKEVIE